jgi:hypothetical protein
MAIKMRLQVVAINKLGLGEEEVRMRATDAGDAKEINSSWSKEERQTDAEFNVMVTVNEEKGQFKVGEFYDISWSKVADNEKSSAAAAKK